VTLELLDFSQGIQQKLSRATASGACVSAQVVGWIDWRGRISGPEMQNREGRALQDFLSIVLQEFYRS
jgi:hypothetical protein